MKTYLSKATVFAALVSLMTFSANVHAQERIQVGVTYYPTSVVAVTGSIPMFVTEDVTHSARTGITYAFVGRPALSATYLLSGPKEDRTYSYVGVGVGVAFPEAPAVSPSFSGHVLAGVNVEITHSFSAFGEVAVAGNSFGSRLSFGAGISYAVGASK